MVKIDNLRNTKIGIRVDRSSALGNPFDLVNTRDVVMRLRVCNAYQEYFDLIEKGAEPINIVKLLCTKYFVSIHSTWKAPNRRMFLEALSDIGANDTLLCWCTPELCHALTIKEWKDSNKSLETDS
jgi:hypothetical protein